VGPGVFDVAPARSGSRRALRLQYTAERLHLRRAVVISLRIPRSVTMPWDRTGSRLHQFKAGNFIDQKKMVLIR
jgi:hypothetical protein